MRVLLSGVAFATLVAVALGSPARAQVPYGVSHSVGAWVPLSGGPLHTPVAYSSFPAWDEGAVGIEIPFEFQYFGEPVTTIYAFTNGFASFDPPPSGGSVLRPPSVVPSRSNAVHNFIGVMWQDLDGGPDDAPVGQIRSLVTGSPGGRVMTVQWSGFLRFGVVGSSVSFQVRLFETSNRIDVVMGPNALVANAVSAVENASGTEGFDLFARSDTCDAACACTPGACSSGHWQPAGRTVTLTLPESAELIGAVDGPSGVFPGADFDVRLTVKNVGLASAPAFTSRLYLTDGSGSGAGAGSGSGPGSDLGTVVHDFGVVETPGLSASSFARVTRRFTMPGNVGTGVFYLAYVVDDGNDVDEATDENNIAHSGPLLTAPDLIGSVSVPTTSGPGETLDVVLDLRSMGAPVSSPVSLTAYFSSDRALDAQDLHAQSIDPVIMPDGFSTTAHIPIVVPASLVASGGPVSVYLIVEIDPGDQVDEVDDTNNLAVSASAIAITRADLTVDAFDAGPIAFSGQPYPVSIKISNTGGAGASDVYVCLMASESILINTFSDACVAKVGPLRLLPASTERLVIQPVVSLAATCNAVAPELGRFFVAAVVDCDDRVEESVETNNVFRRPDAITIREPAPDFVPVAIETASVAAVGEALPVQARIANLGNAPGTTKIRLVLSDNPGISKSDMLLEGPGEAFSISPPQEASYRTWARVPASLPSGVYYAGVLVDPEDEVAEIYEDNNSLAVGPIVVEGNGLAIVSPPPPPALINVPYTRGFAAVGGLGPYVWSVEWVDGAAPPGIAFDAARAELGGTADAMGEGRHRLRVRVASGALVTEVDYTFVVMAPTVDLSVVSSRLPPALAGETYGVELVAVGGVPPYTWRLTSDPSSGSGGGSSGGGSGATLPVGLGLSAEGLLAGEPQLANAYLFSVMVEDQLGLTATGVLSLDVVEASASMTIETADVADAMVGQAYSMVFRVASGTPPYRWNLEGGPIPGLVFGEASGQLTGTPTVAGTYPIIVQATDSRGLFDRNAYVLDVIEEGALRIVLPANGALPSARVGVPYTSDDGQPVRLTATSNSALTARDAGGSTGADGSTGVGGSADGGVGDGADGGVGAGDLEGRRTWALVGGLLPKGISLESATGLLRGTPTEVGATAFIVEVRDMQNDLARATLVINVEDSAATSGQVPPPPGCSCRALGAASMRPAGEGHDASTATLPDLLWVSLLLSSVWRTRVDRSTRRMRSVSRLWRSWMGSKR